MERPVDGMTPMDEDVTEALAKFGPHELASDDEVSQLRQEIERLRTEVGRERENHRTSVLVTLLCIGPFVVGQFAHPSGVWFWLAIWGWAIAAWPLAKKAVPDR